MTQTVQLEHHREVCYPMVQGQEHFVPGLALTLLVQLNSRSAGPVEYSELTCKGVFTMKPNTYTARICGCGNFEQDTYGSTATNEMDAVVIRYFLSWHSSKRSHHTTSSPTTPHKDEHIVSSLDFTRAFLELPQGEDERYR
eukprot:3175837-Amphidinium_carterae.2